MGDGGKTLIFFGPDFLNQWPVQFCKLLSGRSPQARKTAKPMCVNCLSMNNPACSWPPIGVDLDMGSAEKTLGDATDQIVACSAV